MSPSFSSVCLNEERRIASTVKCQKKAALDSDVAAMDYETPQTASLEQHNNIHSKTHTEHAVATYIPTELTRNRLRVIE